MDPSAMTHYCHTMSRVRLEALNADDGDRPYAIMRIIGAGMTKNETFYPADVLAAGAHLYSKAKMMLDHPDFMFNDFSVRNLAGVYGEATWDRDAQGVVAPFYYLDNEAGRLALTLAREEIDLRARGVLGDDDTLVGVSHVAYVAGHRVDADDDGNEYGYSYYEADEIIEVLSGDLVVFPAADGKLLELVESVASAFAHAEGWSPSTRAPRRGVVAREAQTKPTTRRLTVTVLPPKG